MSGNRHWRHCLAAALLALLAPAANGQPEEADASERPAAEQAAGEEEAAPILDREAAQAPEEAGASPELFLPTEEISEDFAVPFPSDI